MSYYRPLKDLHSQTTQLKSDTRAFTIIETLIVLAIAGLIMLITFYAIPALQRSSRNNHRKTDVSLILEAVSQYELKDSGNYPESCGPAVPYCDKSFADPTHPNDGFLQYAYNNLTYYNQDDSVVLQAESSGSAVVNPLNVDTVYIFNFQKCDPTNLGSATSVGADYSNVVALYAIEGGNGTKNPQCQQL